MSNLNCHFVTQFLTKPWEHGERRLWYFDFDENRVREESSKHLFAAVGENTKEVERRLNAIIETPIAADMAALLANSPPSSDLPWPLYRALVLLMMLQPMRTATRDDRSERIEETVMKTDDELDALARAAEQTYQLGRITVRPDAALLYPETGYFPIPAEREDGYYEPAVAIPAGQNQVFLAIPRTVNWESTTALWATNGSGIVANASVGLRGKVVLPPAHKEHSNDEQIAAMLTQMRQASRDLMATCSKANATLTRLDEA